MIDSKKFTRLTTLSKVDFTEEGQLRFIDDLNSIVGFVGKVKEFEGEYDDTADNCEVSYSDLREDVAVSVATPEQLLANAEFENNCYIIPKVID